MAKNSNGTRAMVVGTMLGLVAGAAYALWKTPMSGKELRGKLSATAMDATEGVVAAGSGLSDKMMHAVETSLAPIVGVELGKTANGTQPEETAPFAVVDVAPMESNGSTSGYGTTSIRAQRFAWGSPAPEATRIEPVPATAPVENVEAVAAAPAVEPVTPREPVPVASAGVAEYGTTSIRSKRFAWGAPAPEASVMPQTPEAAPVGLVAKVEETMEIPVVVASNGMHPFPKLGGLE